MRFITPAIDAIRAHKWRTGIIGALALVVLFLGYRFTRPAQPTYVTADVKKGDLTQTVEAVGTVISERDLKLQFSTTGIVSQILVKEGESVRSGQKLVTLRAGDLAAAVAVQAANLRSAQASLQALQEGARPEDIAITEADLENKKASLAAAQASLASADETLKVSQLQLDALLAESDTALSGQRSVAKSTAIEKVTTGVSALSTMDGVFANNDLQDAIIKSDPGRYSSIHTQRTTVGSTLNALPTSVERAQRQDEILAAMREVRKALSSTASVLDQAFAFVAALPTTASFTTTSQETYKATLDTERSKVQAAMTAIDTAMKTLSDAAAGYDTRIAAQRSTLASAQATHDRSLADIRTYQTAVTTAQAQLELKRSPSRSTDVAVAEARVAQAAADLQRARALFSNTILTAPIDGLVTAINVKPGEALPAGPAVTMLGTSALRVEMFVSEIDIPKVQLSQSGSIELDAFRGTLQKLRVTQVDAAPTNKDGVNKYRVKLDFLAPPAGLKVGMTGDASIMTGMRTNVLSVPQRSVLDRDDGTHYVRVLTGQTATEQTVTTGMEGGSGDVEILTGVKEGDTVIVLTK